jgi:hypothetical protein
MTAFLTCGQTRAGLAAVRSLGSAGHAVVVGAAVQPALAQWSRFQSSSLLLPDAGDDPSTFAHHVAEEAHARAARTLLVASDASLWALSRYRSGLPESMLQAMSPHRSVVLALDRVALLDRLQRAGVPVLSPLPIDGQGDVERVLRQIDRDGSLPVLVRPRPTTSGDDAHHSSLSDGAVAATTVAALRQLLYRRHDLVEGGCSVERRPRGRWLAYGALRIDGAVRGEVFQQRVRELDDLSGVSTCARSLPVDAALRRLGAGVMDELAMRGPVLVECFRGADEVLRVVNVIPRLWGSLQLAIRAGFDVPRMMHEPPRDVPVVVARPHVQWRWPLGDARSQWGRLRSLSFGMQGLMTHAATSTTVDEDLDVWRADDPAPALLEARQTLRSIRSHDERYDNWWSQAPLGR